MSRKNMGESFTSGLMCFTGVLLIRICRCVECICLCSSDVNSPAVRSVADVLEYHQLLVYGNAVRTYQ